jgi:hypothetical protein
VTGHQIYIALIKFDFFFLLGFLVQVVSLAVDHKDPEFGLSIAGIFLTSAVMGLAIHFALIEHRAGTIGIIVRYCPYTLCTFLTVSCLDCIHDYCCISVF